jgi:hypothetical protein
MITKKQLKAELNLEAVAIINELLKAAGRSVGVQRSTNIEDADATLVRAAVVHLRQGFDYSEAVARAKSDRLGQQTQEAEPTNAPATSSAALQHTITSRRTNLDRANQAFSKQATTQKAVKDEKDAQKLYWLTRAVAAGSPQVQESEEVSLAREFYYTIASGDLTNADIDADMEAELVSCGFLSPTTIGEAAESVSSSPEPYFCPDVA